MTKRIPSQVVFMALILCLSGCAAVPVGERAIGKDTFATRQTLGKGIAPVADTLLVPEKEKPSVRIIKGEPVKSESEARRLIEKKDDGFPGGKFDMIQSIVLRDVPVRTIAELLTEVCSYNVVATPSAASRKVSVYLKKIRLRDAVESICRLNDIWFREGHGIITLMTREEYYKDVEVRQSDQTRAFFIRYTNAADMAKVIQASMGGEVYLSVIENEKIYGHIDPEQKADVGQGSSKSPEPESKNRNKGLSGVSGSGSGESEAGNAPAASSSSAVSAKPPVAILTVFKRNNCIVARSMDVGLLNEMAGIIESLDTPTSQVLLEIKILQLTLGDGFESFFDWGYTDTGSTNLTGAFKETYSLAGSTSMGTSTMGIVFDSQKLLARMQLLQSQGRAEIVSSPFLMAANNSKVEFFVGEETPLRDDVTTTTVPIGDSGDTMTTFNTEIVREELGTDVTMTTFINEDQTVTMEFEAEISSPLLNFSKVSVVNEKTGDVIDFPLDGTSKSELKSILTAKSGQSIAIGGIIRESVELDENKVPLLGDIPLLGFLFRETKNHKKKTETVIMLTPHVIPHPALAGRVSESFVGRKSSHTLTKEGMDSLFEETAPRDGVISEEISPVLE